MSHVSTFRDYLKTEFGVILPRECALQEQEGVIRVFSKTAMMLKPSGYMGFVAGKVSTRGIEIKSEFAQLFCRSASKNTISLDDAQARAFVESESIPVEAEGQGCRIAKFGRHTLGVGRLRDRSLSPDFIGKGRKRAENSILP